MRIIAGKLGGRQFDSPPGRRTHPMSEKMRGALFNALGDIEGLALLDAFAGSGALSFEAASRGADSVLVIESDAKAQKAIARNIKSLGLAASVKLIKASAGAWLKTTKSNVVMDEFDIVICDPPYDNLQPELLAQLAERVRPGGVVVLSLPPESGLVLAPSFQLLSNKPYGDASLSFYRAPS